ncbi:hypothetical protein AB0H12_07675 [Actinosynnema sp. NPDC023794]
MRFSRAAASWVGVLVVALLAMSVTPASAGTKWSRSNQWGYASGEFSMTEVSGKVTDTNADGLCAMVEIRWYKGGVLRDHDWSPLACPKGDSDTFTKKPGDDPYFTADSVVIDLIPA